MTSSIIQNASGERIDLAFHPGPRRESLVILGHGVTGNKDRPLLLAVAEGLAELGWPCMRISFAGNGESEGRFEEATPTKEVGDLMSVLESVPDWVRVAYIGHSLGSAVGVMTAAHDLRIRLLVSLAGMTYLDDFVQREFGKLTPGSDCMWEEETCPLSQTFVDEMKSLGNILPQAAELIQPWLLIHGSADDVVPVKDGIDAHAAARCAKRWVEIPGAGHSFDETTWPVVIVEVDNWLREQFGEA